MRFNLDVNPPPIKVQCGQDSFLLHHRYMTSSERAEAVEALGRGFDAASEVLQRYIFGWSGVESEDGTPLPFEAMSVEGTVRNLPRVMGRVPWEKQLLASLTQYAMNGVRFARLRDLLSGYVQDKVELESMAAEVEGFLAEARPPVGT